MQMMQLNSLPEQQRGATLMVALILLLLISLIGIGTLRSASMVEKMASNDYQKNLTFRASESAIDVTLANRGVNTVIATPSGTTTQVNVPTNIDGVRADVVYRVIPGKARILEDSTMEGMRIMVTARSSLVGNPNATTVTELGIVKPVLKIP